MDWIRIRRHPHFAHKLIVLMSKATVTRVSTGQKPIGYDGRVQKALKSSVKIAGVSEIQKTSHLKKKEHSIFKMDDMYAKFLPVIRKYEKTPNVELEFRVGKMNRGRFDTNVGKETYSKVLMALNQYAGWESKMETEDTVYYGQNGRRAVCNAKTDEVKRVIKKKIEVVDHALENQPFDVRLGVATETPYEPDEDEEVFDETKTRTRHSFVRKNLVIDVSRVKGNPEDMDTDEDTVYQIELEILKVGTDQEMFNMMYKILDVLKVT